MPSFGNPVRTSATGLPGHSKGRCTSVSGLLIQKYQCISKIPINEQLQVLTNAVDSIQRRNNLSNRLCHMKIWRTLQYPKLSPSACSFICMVVPYFKPA